MIYMPHLDMLVPPSVKDGQHVLIFKEHVLYAIDTTVSVVSESRLRFVQHFDAPIMYISKCGDNILLGFQDCYRVFTVGGDALITVRADIPNIQGSSIIYSILEDKILAADNIGLFVQSNGSKKHVLSRQNLSLASMFMSVQGRPSILVSERCGMHTLFRLNNDGVDCVWSVYLSQGSLVIPVTDFTNMELERQQILQSFQYCLLCYDSANGTLMFLGIQETMVDGVVSRKGEPIFSYTILDHPQEALFMDIVSGGEEFTIKILCCKPASTFIVKPFTSDHPKLTVENGVVLQPKMSQLLAVVACLENKYILSFENGEPVVGATIPNAGIRLHSAFETSDHCAVTKKALLVCDNNGDDGEGLIRRYNGRMWRRNIDGEWWSIGFSKDNQICVPESLFDTITDLQIIDNELISLTRITESGIVHETRSISDLYILGKKKCDGAIASLVDAYTGIYKFSGETLEIATLKDTTERLYEPCKIFSCLSFKVFSLPNNIRAVLVHRKESLDVLVKRFNGGKIVWERMVKLKHICPVDDYTMDERALYIMSNGGIFAHEYSQIFSRPTGYEYASLCLGVYENFLVESNLGNIYKRLQHLQGGFDGGFKSLLIFSAASSSGVDVPMGLIRYSWLQAFLSDCQEQLIQHLLSACESSPSWSVISKFGFPLWLRSDTKFLEVIESVCKLLARNLQENIDLISILYACLGKEKTLVALWRASRHADADKMISFLQSPAGVDHRAVAEKTAFVLLSKQREYLAVFFFVIAGMHEDAMAVAVDRLKDVNLAISISRLSNIKFKREDLAPIERFLVDSIGKIDHFDWAILLAGQKQTDDEWTPSMSYIKRLVSKTHQVEYKLEDIRGFWNDGLFQESMPMISQLSDEELKRQLTYEAETLKGTIMRPTGVVIK